MKFLIIFFIPFITSCHLHSVAQKDTLFVGLGSPPTTLDPRMATDANSQRICDLIFSSLVRIGPDLKAAPEAAESWTFKQKGITFKLRGNLRFQDGSPVTSEDILYSFDEFRKPTSSVGSALKSIKEVTATDKIITLTLKEPDASLLLNLALVKILPKKIVSTSRDFALKPLGSGPYALATFDENELTLERSNYPNNVYPEMKAIQFKFIRDENVRLLKILKGDIDILSNELSEENVSLIQKSKKEYLTILVTPGLNFNYLLINLKNKKLQDLRYRKALMAAISRPDIIKYKLENMASLATSILAPFNPFSNPELKFPEFSLEKAKNLIHALGLENQELVLKTSNQAEANGRILSSQLERLGIRVKLQSYEWGTYYDDIKKGNFEVALMRWVGIVDPDVYRDTLSTSEVPPGKNRGFYSNKKFDELVERAHREMDFEKRKVLYFKAEQIVADDIPLIPLWYNSNISIVNTKVKNFRPIVTGSFYPMLDVSK